jgi:putative transposase
MLRRIPRTPDYANRWLTFLRNHREAIAAMDFFTVPTLRFDVLYCFFVNGHDRRKILRFNVAEIPTLSASSSSCGRRGRTSRRTDFFCAIATQSSDLIAAVTGLGSQPIRTAFRSPWQNGVAERWVGSCRRDLLDHVIVLNEQHLKRLMSEYVRYYHEDRTHLGLAKDPQQAGQQQCSYAGPQVSLLRSTRRPTSSLRHCSVDSDNCLGGSL